MCFAVSPHLWLYSLNTAIFFIFFKFFPLNKTIVIQAFGLMFPAGLSIFWVPLELSPLKLESSFPSLDAIFSQSARINSKFTLNTYPFFKKTLSNTQHQALKKSMHTSASQLSATQDCWSHKLSDKIQGCRLQLGYCWTQSTRANCKLQCLMQIQSCQPLGCPSEHSRP